MSLHHYILDEAHNVIDLGEGNAALFKWAEWFEHIENRRVAETFVGRGRDWRVSTVFLGIDMSFSMAGPPLLFETMVFWQGQTPVGLSDWDHYQDRYSTWAQAWEGHQQACRELQEAVSANEAAEAEAEARFSAERRNA